MDPWFKVIGGTARFSPYWASQLQWAREARRGLVNRRVINAMVDPGVLAVDVGANNGLFSARMLRLVGHRGHVLAIEPQPRFSPALERLAQRPNLTYFLGGAGAECGAATLHVPKTAGETHTGLASLQPHPHATDEETAEIEIRPLDSLIAPLRRPVGFLKIDVEGLEHDVLLGAAAVLGERPRMLIEIEQRHHQEPITALIDGILDRGYDCWFLHQQGLAHISTFDLERDQIQHVTGGFQDVMPVDYANDFLFLPVGQVPPRDLVQSR